MSVRRLLFVAVAVGIVAVPGTHLFGQSLIEDFDHFPYLWEPSRDVTLDRLSIADGDPLALPGQVGEEHVLSVTGPEPRGHHGHRHPSHDRPSKPDRHRDFAVRPFAASEDWSASDGVRFWYYGRSSGEELHFLLDDNRAPDPGPRRWTLLWQDEFRGRAGEAPDPQHWTPEVGDGTAQGIPGWGNNELQYYTADPANAQLDGRGNLVITAAEADGSLSCYYGPCLYTSARLISQHKVEIGPPGRIDVRLQVPGGAGLWPAFWTLGANLAEVGWPTAGEIDIMEHVGRRPTEIFGTIHGPGYSGGAGITGLHDLGEPVADRFHVFSIVWERDRIDWYVDGLLFHSASPDDTAGNPWVFDDPFFMITNLAVGGNLGGPVGGDVVFPRRLLIDYVRVYQARDSAERFAAGFVDDFTGWQQVSLPWEAFARSDRQPPGAPDDGLTLTEVWGYGFALPEDGVETNPLLLDRVELLQPTSYVVTNTNDGGPGSLRFATDLVADGGVVSFDPALAGSTITFTSGPLWIRGKTVTIDGSTAPGLVLDGGGTDRLLIVDAGAGANLHQLTMTDGWAFDLAGAILNNGSLVLDRVVVTGNTVFAQFNDFWKGGGGIYAGGGSTTRLVDSTVADNETTLVDGGGVYGFLGSNVVIENSTLSGNTAGNVGGGLRMLGSGTITNSTISGNTSAAWYGGAIFHTDGVLALRNSTITGNVQPGFADAAIFVGTFTAANATLTLANTIVGDNVGTSCFVGAFGAGSVTLTSSGNNLFTDGTCNPVASDLVLASAGLAALGDNGGPTPTHRLLAASGGIDAANGAACPATDQRGVTRPQGAGCDIGSFELEP
jgi:beta-glucanase (GH16 family)